MHQPFLSLPIENLQKEEPIRGLYIYKDDVSLDIWDELVNLVRQGRPSGYEHPSMFGPRGKVKGTETEY